MTVAAQLLTGCGVRGLEMCARGCAKLHIGDPPWGATHAKWDRPLDWPRWWRAIDHVLAPDGIAVVFMSARLSWIVGPLAPRRFSYDLILRKNRASGHLNAKRAPLRAHESIYVFGDPAKGPTAYRPQFTEGHGPMSSGVRRSFSKLYRRETTTTIKAGTTRRYATSVLDVDVVPNDRPVRIHETQKPVELLRWLVRAYTEPGDLVIDSTFGSGASLKAAEVEGRRALGWEIDPARADRARRWLEGRDTALFAGVA